MNGKKKILFIAASPDTLSKTGWEKEFKTLQRLLRRGELKKKYDERIIPHATAQDIVDLLEPHCWIIHFSAHGDRVGKIILESEDRGKFIAESKPLLEVISQSTGVKCFVFNSCDSEELAEMSIKHVDYAIGVEGKISNTSAVEFVRLFYQSFSDYETIPMAYKIALSNVKFVQSKDMKIVFKFRNPAIMDIILQGKIEELQNLEGQSKSGRAEIDSLRKDIEKVGNAELKSVFANLLKTNPFPKGVFWFIENKSQLANQVGQKILSDKSGNERNDFSADLSVLFELLDACLVTEDLRPYSKTDLEGLTRFPKAYFEQAFDELPHLVPENVGNDEFIAYFRDNIKYLKALMS